ncbi:DUF2142 domain-containing protein [Patulibacter defluvii]|uniref:DUF2142 domain-containing protein n=1 Tax=Patulibacter defluvii TaxID=3095358 RepID=UPI002A75D42C|nr:DUF2142 domain-containing protein [Patulibacter sp. DM4]
MSEAAARRTGGRPRLVLGLGLGAAIAVVLLLVLLAAPSGWRTQTINNVAPAGPVVTADRGHDACAIAAEIPAEAGRAEFRAPAGAELTARVRVERPGTAARRSAVQTIRAGGDGRLRPLLPRGVTTAAAATVCLEPTAGRTPILGDGGTPSLRLVGAAPQSRLDQLGAMLDRAGRMKGRPLDWFGGWRLLLLAAATIGLALAVAVRVWSRPEGTPLGRRTWAAVAVVALLHAWTWAALTPAFQVPDEASHFQYAAYIADHGDLPSGKVKTGSSYSESHARAEEQLQTAGVAFRGDVRPPWSPAAEQRLDDALRGASRAVPDVETNATGQPPLYYLSVTPAALGGGSALDQLGRMRLLSGLWLVLAALGAIALVRTLAPRPRWAVTAGLAVALFPLLGFLAGGVTPDVAMTALALWLFAAAARCWTVGTRTGTVVPVAVLVVLLGLTKLTALAVLPGALLIVLAALIRDARRAGTLRVLVRPVGTAIAAVAGIALIFALLTVVSDRSLLSGSVGDVTTGAANGRQAGGLMESLSNTWQLFLPRLPFQQDAFAGFPLWNLWINGLVGQFGYLDYSFAEPVRVLVTGVWLLLVALAIAGLLRIRRTDGWSALRWNAAILVGGAVAVVGLLLVIGRVDFTSRTTGGPPFQQARYLLPALPVALLAIPLALRALADRWRPALGVLLVAGSTLWVAGAWAITLVRYHG